MNTSIYEDKQVLITGGMGFIGKNLLTSLIEARADVTVLTHTEGSLHFYRLYFEELANRFGSKIKIIVGDTREAGLMKILVEEKDFIFNLAALVSHKDQGIVPLDDLDINTRGHITLLEALRLRNRNARVVFSSTRMVYSDNQTCPLKETDPTDPASYYGISKLAAEKYHLLFHKRYGIPVTILRIGNPYGDWGHFSNGRHNIPGWLMREAMNGETVQIRSDGKQGRDYLYIGDLVEIMMRIALLEKTNGKTYNTGNGFPLTFGDMVNALSETVSTGKFEYVKNPVSENGSYSLDVSRLHEDLEWKPETSLIEGVRRMYEFAKSNSFKEIQ